MVGVVGSKFGWFFLVLKGWDFEEAQLKDLFSKMIALTVD